MGRDKEHELISLTWLQKGTNATCRSCSSSCAGPGPGRDGSSSGRAEENDHAATSSAVLLQMCACVGCVLLPLPPHVAQPPALKHTTTAVLGAVPCWEALSTIGFFFPRLFPSRWQRGSARPMPSSRDHPAGFCQLLTPHCSCKVISSSPAPYSPGLCSCTRTSCSCAANGYEPQGSSNALGWGWEVALGKNHETRDLHTALGRLHTLP